MKSFYLLKWVNSPERSDKEYAKSGLFGSSISHTFHPVFPPLFCSGSFLPQRLHLGSFSFTYSKESSNMPKPVILTLLKWALGSQLKDEVWAGLVHFSKFLFQHFLPSYSWPSSSELLRLLFVVVDVLRQPEKKTIIGYLSLYLSHSLYLYLYIYMYTYVFIYIFVCISREREYVCTGVLALALHATNPDLIPQTPYDSLKITRRCPWAHNQE